MTTLRAARCLERSPVEQANRYDVTVNLKTAKALGLTIPPSLLVRANAIVQ